MKVPKVRKRRLFDRRFPKGYLESDNDFVRNNMRAAVWFLEHRDEIVAALKTTISTAELARLTYGERQ